MTPPIAAATLGQVLVIDDNPIIQRTLYFALRDKGYAVQMCGEISEALKIVRQGHLDAILLDLNFPPDPSVNTTSTHDGFWALGWINRMHEVKHTPIIVVTSDPPEKSKAQALAAGAAAYFQKPVDKELLAATLASLLTSKTAVAAH